MLVMCNGNISNNNSSEYNNFKVLDSTLKGNNRKRQQCNKFSRFRSRHAVAPSAALLSLPLPPLLLMMMMALLILPHNSHQFPSVPHNLSDENENNEVLDIAVQPRFAPYDALEAESPTLTENLEEAIRNSVKSEIEMERSTGSSGSILHALKNIPEEDVQETRSDEILSIQYQQKPTPALDMANTTNEETEKDFVEEEREETTTNIINTDTDEKATIIAIHLHDMDSEPDARTETETAAPKLNNIEMLLVHQLKNENFKNESIRMESEKSKPSTIAKDHEVVHTLTQENFLVPIKATSAEQTSDKPTQAKILNEETILPIHASQPIVNHISKIEPDHALQSIEERLTKSNLFSTEQTSDGLLETKLQGPKEKLHSQSSSPSIQHTSVGKETNESENIKVFTTEDKQGQEKPTVDLVSQQDTHEAQTEDQNQARNEEEYPTTETIILITTPALVNENLSIVLDESVASTEQTDLVPPMDGGLMLLSIEKGKEVLEYQTTTIIPVQDVHIIIKKQGVEPDYNPDESVSTTIVATMKQEPAITAHKETLKLPIELEDSQATQSSESSATPSIDAPDEKEDPETNTHIITTTHQPEDQATQKSHLDQSWHVMPAASTVESNSLSVKGSRSINTAQKNQIEEAVATLFEAYSPRDAGQTFNDHMAAESNGDIEKALPTKSLHNEPYSSSTSIIMLCTSASLLFILISAVVYFISFHQYHGTLDIEMQEQRCGKDNLDEEDADAETCSKLLEIDLTKTVDVIPAAEETDQCL